MAVGDGGAPTDHAGPTLASARRELAGATTPAGARTRPSEEPT